MTDVLDRPVSPVARDATGRVPERRRRPASLELDVGVRILLATLSAGAGAIHLVLVPSHWDESVVEGIGFAVTGWLQLAFAVALFARPSRLLLRVGLVVNAAAIGVWAWSRVFGLPIGAHANHAEDAGFVDLTCVAFEAALVVGCAVLLSRPRLGARFARGGIAVAGIASIGVLALTTSTLASPSVRDHAAAGHGEAAVAGDGHAHGAASPAGDDKGLSLLSNGQHEHIAPVDLDAGTQQALDAQLAVTREVAALTPTVADALAAGYQRVGPYFPGIGAHYMKGLGRGGFGGSAFNPDGVIDDADLRNPLMLIFDGTTPTSEIAGFMYYSMAGAEPAGFAGRNDFWHFHESLCLKYTADGIDVPYGLDHEATPRQCARAGGTMLETSQYMVHVWSVPGYEMTKKDGGVFGEVNPELTCADGSYYQLPVREWASHPLNVCKAT